MLSVSGAFFPSRVVIPSPASLPLETGSNGSHPSLQLLTAPILQATTSGHQAGAACDRRGLCPPGHTPLCAKLPAGFGSPPFAAYLAAGRGAISPRCQGRQPRRLEVTREREAAPKPSGAAASLTLHPSSTAALGYPRNSKRLVTAPSHQDHFKHCPAPLSQPLDVSSPPASSAALWKQGQIPGDSQPWIFLHIS